tara:strand:- start:61 stop:261 length:201 start_codon:yes stop_codon:yes gene_type:complete
MALIKEVWKNLNSSNDYVPQCLSEIENMFKNTDCCLNSQSASDVGHCHQHLKEIPKGFALSVFTFD